MSRRPAVVSFEMPEVHPAIAGQPAQFVVDRLHEFQQRAREKTPQPGSMTAVSVGMSEEQIRAYAAYLSQLQR
jgi:cytochrome c553